jgi:DNA-binding SARP family transcriptional activator
LEHRGETRIQICGRLVVRLHGERIEQKLPGRQGQLLFTYLAASRPRWVRRDELVEAVWPGNPPRAWEAALNALVSKLRRVTGPDVLDGRSQLRLNLPADAWIDLEAAADGIHRAESAIAQRQWARAWGPAHVVVHTANRGFLEDFDAPWIDERRRELTELQLRGLECLAAAGIGLGGTELATAERAARRLVREAPFRETGYRFLMEVLAAQGNAAEALRAYDQLRCLLRDELGVAPGAEVQALYERLLHPGAVGST